MIKKLEVMVKATTTGSDLSAYVIPGGNYTAELTVSTLDIVNKVNEIIEYLNSKEN